MFRKAVGAVSGLCGSTIDFLDAAIFAKIPENTLLTPLFKPLGCLMAAATLPGPFLEEDKGKKLIKCLGYIPAATANVAIWAVEGSAVAYVFSIAIGASGVVMLAEAAYKKCQGEEVDKWELLIRTGKISCILLTLNLGGTGKIFELIKEGGVTVGHKVASYAAAGFAAFSGIKSLATLFGKCCCPVSESKDPLLNDADLEAQAATEMSSFQVEGKRPLLQPDKL